MSKFSSRLLPYLVAFFIPLIGGGVVLAESQTPAFSSDPAAVKSRLENVRRLVTTSSGARRIIEGTNATAKLTRAKAESFLDSAEISFRKGDINATQTHLQRATEEMFSAIRHVGTGEDGIEKRIRDFDNKAKSVDVLLTAIDRVATEKGGKEDVKQRAASIRERGQAAQRLADKGQLVVARKKLDGVYEDAKIELERLREGETLVRTLEFANAEEEYNYELDRNDTHQMLLKVLLGDKTKQPGTQKLIDQYSGKSEQLRMKAEKEAKGGAFDQAVDSLEQATKYLQRAIRSAGVYIPG